MSISLISVPPVEPVQNAVPFGSRFSAKTEPMPIG